MKFNGFSSSTVFDVSTGYDTAGYESGERVKQFIFQNGASKFVDFGTRKEKIAKLEIIRLTKDDADDIFAYLSDNIGERIQITETNEHESFFTENFSDTIPFSYYVQLLTIGNVQEDDFSVNRKTYRMQVEISLTGVTSVAKLNTSTDGLINVLVKFSPSGADTKASALPLSNDYSIGDRIILNDQTPYKVYERTKAHCVAPATANKSGFRYSAGGFPNFLATVEHLSEDVFEDYEFNYGDLVELVPDFTNVSNAVKAGFYQVYDKVNDRKIRLVDNSAANWSGVGADSSTYFRVGSGWSYLMSMNYVAPPNNYNLIEGSFYWSALFDMDEADYSDIITEDYKAGYINYQTINIPDRYIDLSNGVSIETKSGFNFSVSNGQRFWKFLTDNGYSYIGGIAEIYLYRRLAGNDILQKVASGYVSNIEFSYESLKFNCEPVVLDRNKDFPIKLISDDDLRYIGANKKAIGEPVFVTYGDHELAALQNISKDETLEVFSSTNGDGAERETSNVIGYPNPNGLSIVVFNTNGEYNYTFSDEQIQKLGSGRYVIKVLSNTNGSGQDNVGVVRRITSIDTSNVGYYLLIIDDSLPYYAGYIDMSSPPISSADTSALLSLNILLATEEHQFNEDFSGGFFSSDREAEFSDSLNILYEDENGDMTPIPSNISNVNSAKNLLSINYRSVSGDDEILLFSEVTSKGEKAFVKNYKNIQVYEKTQFEISGGEIPIDASFAQDGFRKARELVPIAYNWPPSYSWTFLISSPNDNDYLFSVAPEFVGSATYERRYNLAIQETKTDSELVIHRVMSSTYQGFIEDNTQIVAVQFDITNKFISSERIENGSEVYLSVDFFLKNIFSYSGTFISRREQIRAGTKIVMRFQLKDGNFITNEDWEHEIDKDKMGQDGRLRVCNFPNSETDVQDYFADGVSSLSSRYDYYVDLVSNNKDSIPVFERIVGVSLFEPYTGKTYKIETYRGAWIEVESGLVTGVKILVGVLESGYYGIYTYNSVTKLLTGVYNTSSAFYNYNSEDIPTLSGQGLFDVSELFEETRLFDLCSSVQFLLINKDDDNNLWRNTNQSGSQIGCFWESSIYVNRSPSLFILDTFKKTNRQLFSAVKGKVLPSGGTTSAKEISQDILNTSSVYKINQTDFDYLFSLPQRVDLKFRRQFLNQLSSTQLLQQLLQSLWAVALIDEDGNISLKPLDLVERPPSNNHILNDTNIIYDSIATVKTRDRKELYNDFEVKYAYSEASKLAKSISEFEKMQTMVDLSTEYKGHAEAARRIFNISKKKTIQDYFLYENSSPFYMEHLVKFFSYIAEEVELEVEIDKILGTGGIKYMDTVQLNSYFYTGGVSVYGFVNKLSIDVNNYKAKLGLYIVKPIGYLPNKDNVTKDAGVSIRSLGGYVINDAGDTDRTLGDYTIDDAGTSERGITPWLT